MLISCGNFVRVEQEGENQLVWVLLIVIGNFVFEDEVVDGAAFIHERKDKLKDEGDGAIQYRYLFTPLYLVFSHFSPTITTSTTVASHPPPELHRFRMATTKKGELNVHCPHFLLPDGIGIR